MCFMKLDRHISVYRPFSANSICAYIIAGNQNFTIFLQHGPCLFLVYINVHAISTYIETEILLHAFVTSTLDGDE